MSAKNDRCYIAAFVSGLLGIILLRVEKHKKGSAVTLINVVLCAVLYILVPIIILKVII